MPKCFTSTRRTSLSSWMVAATRQPVAVAGNGSCRCSEEGSRSRLVHGLYEQCTSSRAQQESSAVLWVLKHDSTSHVVLLAAPELGRSASDSFDRCATGCQQRTYKYPAQRRDETKAAASALAVGLQRDTPCALSWSLVCRREDADGSVPRSPGHALFFGWGRLRLALRWMPPLMTKAP